jgi:diguanylate cyclase (GGDEF)-like protein
VALLLSGSEPVEELFERLALGLAEFVDASTVLIAIGSESGARIAYAYQEGLGRAPDDPVVSPESTIGAVLREGTVKLYASRREWPQQRALAIGGRVLELPESAIFVPIAFGGTRVGVLSVQSQRAGAYRAEDAALLETCALYLGARIADTQRREQSLHFERLAATDALTGLANRRALDEALHKEWRRSARTGRPLTIALVDVDYFKAFNDAYGHVAGDACLRQVAGAIANAARRSAEVVARYGGEEFAVVLPETDERDAIALGESICESVRELGIPHQGSSLGYVSVSVGVHATAPHAKADPQEAIRRADALLYRAKNGGRNRVAANGYESSSPEVRVRARSRHNLPAPRSRLIGRVRDVDLVAEGLRRGRLVTIVGPGGVGKTRLALEVAQAMVGPFPGGVWFVDLAPVTEAALVPSRIAQAIGADLAVSADALAALAEHLKPLQALLLIDNCEHLVAAAASAVDRLLADCPHVRILATSREPLRIAGESAYRLAPLDRDAAIELFRERAREADVRFAPSPDESGVIASICKRLDGIALAIELAAARVKMLSVAALSDRLDERFRILTSGSRTALARQQTMRALIDWSYDLLTDRERFLLRRLSLFATSFSNELAAAACGESSDDAFDLLTSLVEKSLVVADVSAGDARYRLLESTREYARERLVEGDELQSASRAYASAFADAAERWDGAWQTASDRLWQQAVEPELENSRAAMEWTFGPTGEALLGQRIIAAIHRSWSRYSAVECERWVRAALDAVDATTPPATIARLELARANVAMAFSRRNDCRSAAERASAILANDGNPLDRTEAKALVGWVLASFGQREEGTVLLQEALAAFRRLGARRSTGWALYLLANARWASGDVEGARPLFAQALAIYTQIGAEQSIGIVAGNLAEAEFRAGDAEAALRSAERALASHRALALTQGVAWTLCNTAAYLVSQGRWDEARACAREGLDAARERGMAVKAVWAIQHLAAVATLRPGAIARRDDARRAASLLGFADRRLAEIGAARMYTEQQEYDRMRAALRETLGESEAATLAEQGSHWDEARAIAETLTL